MTQVKFTMFNPNDLRWYQQYGEIQEDLGDRSIIEINGKAYVIDFDPAAFGNGLFGMTMVMIDMIDELAEEGYYDDDDTITNNYIPYGSIRLHYKEHPHYHIQSYDPELWDNFIRPNDFEKNNFYEIQNRKLTNKLVDNAF